MKTFYYIGTKKQLRADESSGIDESFMTKKEFFKEYGSIKEAYRIHGKKYVHRVIVKKNGKRTIR